MATNIASSAVGIPNQLFNSCNTTGHIGKGAEVFSGNVQTENTVSVQAQSQTQQRCLAQYRYLILSYNSVGNVGERAKVLSGWKIPKNTNFASKNVVGNIGTGGMFGVCLDIANNNIDRV